MKKKFFISLFIVAVIGFGIFIHLFFNHKQSYEPQTNIQAPIEIPEETVVKGFDISKSKKPVVVMFYVDWCGYCRRFMPIYGEISKELNKKFTFSVVNCDYPENKELVEKYHINHFPTLYINDKDLDFEYEINSIATQDNESFKSELEKHLKLRSKLHK